MHTCVVSLLLTRLPTPLSADRCFSRSPWTKHHADEQSIGLRVLGGKQTLLTRQTLISEVFQGSIEAGSDGTLTRRPSGNGPLTSAVKCTRSLHLAV